MKIGCMSGVEYNGKVVFSSLYTNGLFELDTDSRRVRLICVLDKEKFEQSLYRRAFLYKNEAWFLPQRGKYILNINLDTYDVKYFDLIYSQKYEESPNYPYYFSFIDGRIVNGNKLVCIPSGIDSIILIDMDLHTLSKIEDISCPPKDMVHTVYESEESLFVLSKEGNLDICVNLATLETKRISSEFGDKCFSSSILYGNTIYLIPDVMPNERKAYLGCMDLMTSKTDYYLMNKANSFYYGGIAYDKGIILFPNNATILIRFLHDEKSFEEIDYPKEIKEIVSRKKITIRPIDSVNRKMASLIYEGYIIEFDQDGNITDYYNIEKATEKDILELLSMNQAKGNNIVKECGDLLYEDSPFSINDFMAMI